MNTMPALPCHLAEPLTPAEETVLNLLAQGMSDKEIGLKLSIAPITVRGDHKQNIYDKLGLQPGFRNRKWAVYCARQLGLLPGVDQEEAPPGDNPYKGLDAFQQDDAHMFFGRETFVKQLLARLSQNGSTPRFLAVVGPSGSGKSSVIRAGLIPALGRDQLSGASTWTVATMFPRVNPFFELETALRRVAIKQQPDLLELLQGDSYGLARAARLIQPEDRPLLLVIDQFEEIFTLVENSAEARRFMDLIYAAVTDPRSTVRVIVTLRADFLDRPLMYPDFSWLVQAHTAMVVPLSPDELERAITLPSQQAHVSIEPGLVARLVAEAHEQPGALPLLEFTLTELYDNRIGSTITMSTYDEIGGLQQALAAQANKVYAGLDDRQQAASRQLFLRLITLGEGTEDVRRRVPTSELASLDVPAKTMDYITHFLAANRLLTLDLDPTTKEPLVEVAHEALIREWVQLRTWLDESRNDVRTERLLALAVDDWHRHDRGDGYLMQGAKLAQFEGWRGTTDLALTAAEHTYLDASIAERDRQQRRRRTIRNLGLAATFAVAIVLAGLALWANSQRSRAETEKDHAETAEQEALRQASIGLAAQAVTELESASPERSVLLALEALNNYPYTPQAEKALAQAVSAVHASTTISNRDVYTRNIAFSPDGKQLAMVGDERIIPIWDTDTGREVKTINDSGTGTQEVNTGVDWSSDGRFIVTSSVVSGIRQWDLATGDLLQTYDNHGAAANKVYLNQNDRLILISSADSVARVLDVESGAEVLSLQGHEASVTDARWSPDETLIVTTSMDGTARLWSAADGAQLQTFLAHPAGVLAVAWSPDGRFIATCGNDGLARVWDIESGEAFFTLIGHDMPVRDVAWSPDGKWLATAGADGTVRVWDARDGARQFTLFSVENDLSVIRWSPDSQRLASAGGLTARIWDVGTPTTIRLVGHTFPTIDVSVYETRWSPDGAWIVSAGPEPSVRVWDPATGKMVASLLPDVPIDSWAANAAWSPTSDMIFVSNQLQLWSPFTNEVRMLSADAKLIGSGVWSPDGKRILVSDIPTSTNVIIDASTGQHLSTFTFNGCQFVGRAAWSPDSTRVATTCFSGATTAIPIWDTTTGETVLELVGHTDGSVGVNWSPDGAQLATTSADTTVRVWDAETGAALTVFTGHSEFVFDVSWSPNGKRLVSGDAAGMVRVWEASNGYEVDVYKAPGGALTTNWSPDGTKVVIGGRFSAPVIRRVWRSTDDLIAHARECCVWRDLTREEREQFGLSDPTS
jgi:WD40 repeat protein/DNA-binding CsgD family transcriptional regulator